MPEKRLVIFDLDNTLVVNRPAAKLAYEAAIRFLCKEAKLEFAKLHNHWRRLVQKLQVETAPEKRAFEYSLQLLTEAHHIADTLIPPTLKVYEKELLTNLRLMPGSKELVNWLKEKGSLIAVAAGTDRSLAKRKLKSSGLLPAIDKIISASEVGNMKPDPKYFQMILDELDIKKTQAIIISDSKKEDIEIAQKMGIRAILIPTNNAHLSALKTELAEFLTFAK